MSVYTVEQEMTHMFVNSGTPFVEYSANAGVVLLQGDHDTIPPEHVL